MNHREVGNEFNNDRDGGSIVRVDRGRCHPRRRYRLVAQVQGRRLEEYVLSGTRSKISMYYNWTDK